MAEQHQLILELVPRLRRFARAISGDADAGDDAVKSAIVDALQQPFASQNKKRLFCRLLSSIYADLKVQDRTGAGRPVAANAAPDLSNAAKRLMSLSLPERAALVLVTTEELAYHLIAEVMGTGEAVARGHLARARGKLCVDSNDQPDSLTDGEGHVRAASTE